MLSTLHVSDKLIPAAPKKIPISLMILDAQIRALRPSEVYYPARITWLRRMDLGFQLHLTLSGCTETDASSAQHPRFPPSLFLFRLFLPFTVHITYQFSIVSSIKWKLHKGRDFCLFVYCFAYSCISNNWDGT